MKMYCVKCQEVEELSSDELKEVSEFVMNNNLEAVDYLNYMSLKVGKKCTDNKKHTFLFDNEWQEHIIKLTRDVKDTSEKRVSYQKTIEELKGKIKELEHQTEVKDKEVTDLNFKESDIMKEIVETTGNNKLELWK